MSRTVAMSDTWMPRAASTNVFAISWVSAGTFCVAKVRAFLWLLMVPIGALTAEPEMAPTTCSGPRSNDWSRSGFRRTWNWRDGPPSTWTLATPGTRSSSGVSALVTYVLTSPRLAPEPETPNCRTGMAEGSKVWTIGEYTPRGSTRATAETFEATLFASLFWSVDWSKLMMIWLAPVELTELMSVIPPRVETAFSRTCVIC